MSQAEGLYDEHAAGAPHTGCDCIACDDARYEAKMKRRPGTIIQTHTTHGQMDMRIERYRAQHATFYDITNAVGSLTITDYQASELRKALDYLLGPDND